MEESNLTALIVIGGSAGSLNVLLNTLPHLNAVNCPPLIIVIHRKSADETSLADLLQSKTSLAVKEADDKDQLQKNVIYIAPPDYHLLIENDGTLSLDDSEKVNYSRPSIDVTFQAAAESFGERVLCILLSGANADGSDGVEAVKANGGLVAVQYPASAEVSYMPQQALERVKPDYLIDTNQKKALAGLINGMAR